jgi:multiple sugar transport system permease protein
MSRAAGTHVAARASRTVLLVVLAIVFLLPYYLLLRNGLSSQADITAPNWTFFPTHIQWSNFTDLFDDPEVPFARALANSAIISITQTALTLLLSGLAGYGLAKIPMPGKNVVMGTVVVTLMIPSAITFVPSFVMVSSLGWVASLRGLIIPGLFSAFATFLFRQYFLAFPKELEEAAELDGLGYWRTFWRIVVPNSGSFAAAIATITFIGSWNAFLWPLVIGGHTPSSYTVQIALSTFLTSQSPNLPELFLAAFISLLPLLLLFLFLQRFIVAGVEQSGLD